MNFESVRRYLGFVGFALFAVFVLCEIFAPAATGSYTYNDHTLSAVAELAGLIWLGLSLFVFGSMWNSANQRRDFTLAGLGAFVICWIGFFFSTVTVKTYAWPLEWADFAVSYGFPLILLINLVMPVSSKRAVV